MRDLLIEHIDCAVPYILNLRIFVSNEQWAANAALIVKAVNSHYRLVDLVRTLIQNDPAEPIADNGMVVIDKWRDDARKFLASIGEKT